jgi:hypothetical protein
MTASTPDELIVGFPHSPLPKVAGEPTFEDLKVIRRLLNTNAMRISSYVGGGRHGHLGIIMTNEEYFAIADDIFPVPGYPGASPEVTHLNALLDEIVGYENFTSLDLLTHLLTFYAMISPTELTQNNERLNTPYDPNQPIEALFQQIQDARAFAVAGGQPYGNAMIVNVAYTLVFNVGLFPDACRALHSRAIAGKTWAQFKIDLAAAHPEFLLTNQTAQQSGFHSANMMIEQGRYDSMQETAEAIAQLATTMTSDRGTLAALTTTNAKLANQLEAAHALIIQLNSKIATLKIKIKPV